ncbi:hypothetical protein DDE18_10455 [Nocardioides gansuensis]|uniref:Uncharacterized protein n=1 Tax=Nocardioides gansuensis TaxID=2138300 RepID=A0A2T8FAN6_9ACTN|nr:hypothetical protein [Nocardioides gansuensis]PVG82774.1 hypothetical protein DDE18_10455 [Nocardioides gansuensis]
MTLCARCSQELGIGRFCTNCGHRIGEPVPAEARFGAPVPAGSALGPELPRTPLLVAGVVVLLLLLVLLVSCLG